MAGYIDVHVLDLTGCETDCALAQRAGNKVLLIHSGVTMIRWGQILMELLTEDERVNAVYHGPLLNSYVRTSSLRATA